MGRSRYTLTDHIKPIIMITVGEESVFPQETEAVIHRGGGCGRALGVGLGEVLEAGSEADFWA